MATATEVLQMILRARDDASAVFSRFGAGIIAFNQGLELAQKLLGAMETALRPVIGFLIESAKAADESALAESKLAATLQSTGQFSGDYVESLKQIAAQFQTLTGLSDEVILDTERQLIAFGASRQEIVPLTQAVLDLSAGLGTDLASATFLVSKALQGETQMLGRYGIQVSEGASAAQKMVEIQEQINQKFGGQAIARMQTMGGQLSLLKQNYNNLQEAIGASITESEAFKGLMEELNRLISEGIQFVSANKDVMKAWVKEGLLIAIEGLGILAQAANQAVQTVGALDRVVEVFISRPLAQFALIGEAIADRRLGAAIRNNELELGDYVGTLKKIAIQTDAASGKIQEGLVRIRAAIATGVGTGDDQRQAAKDLERITGELSKQRSALDEVRNAKQALSVIEKESAIAALFNNSAEAQALRDLIVLQGRLAVAQAAGNNVEIASLNNAISLQRTKISLMDQEIVKRKTQQLLEITNNLSGAAIQNAIKQEIQRQQVMEKTGEITQFQSEKMRQFLAALSAGYAGAKQAVDQFLTGGMKPTTEQITEMARQVRVFEANATRIYGTSVPDSVKQASAGMQVFIRQLADAAGIDLSQIEQGLPKAFDAMNQDVRGLDFTRLGKGVDKLGEGVSDAAKEAERFSKTTDAIQSLPGVLADARAQVAGLPAAFGEVANAAGSARDTVAGINSELRGTLSLLQTINAQGGVRVAQ